MPEKMVPLSRTGEMVNLAMTPHDFFHRKLLRKSDAPTDSMRTADMETYAEAHYRLGDRYEDGSEYDGPKTQRQYESQQAERRAERAAEASKAEPAKAEAPKAEAKKD